MKKQLTVATYNICHGLNFEESKSHSGPVRLDKTAQAISLLQADILGLNEVYNSGNESLREQAGRLAQTTDMKAHAFACAITLQYEESADYGNALLSRYPILSVETFPVVPDTREGDGYYEDRVVLKAVIDVGVQIVVIATHFGLNPSEHEKMMEILLPIIDKEDRPLVLMGDFNLQPDSEYLQPLYERLQDASLITGKRGFTFASYDPHQTIDYLFFSKHFKVCDFEVVDLKTSDHFPIKAVVDIEI